jgi:hypothetical protein
MRKSIATHGMAMMAAMLMVCGEAQAGGRYRGCYTTQIESGSVTCAGNSSQSADFSSSCTSTSPRVVEIPVECPSMRDDSTSGDYYDGADKNA